MRLFDTAGMRKPARVNEKVESLAVSDSLRAVRFSDIVIVLIDATTPFESQDLRIADRAEQEGRAVVVAVNKWDLVKNKKRELKRLQDEFAAHLPQLRGAPLVAVSALNGEGLTKLHSQVLTAWEIWNRRVPTGELNRWLDHMAMHHPPPAPAGRRIQLRYITQFKARPPSFVLMCSHPGKLPDSYSRYLVNGLREHFGFAGTPIRILLRSQSEKNPFATN